MSRNIASDEIDLLDLILIIWKKKWYFVSGIILCFFILIIHQINKPPSQIIASTEIRPITVFDEAKYKIYNLFINTIKPDYLIEDEKQKIDKNGEITKISKSKAIVDFAKDLEINNINKKFLFDLFIDRLRQKSNLVAAIKKFNFIKREDYINNIDYENKVMKTASAFSLLNLDLDLEEKKSPVIIQFKTYDKQKIENFLKLIEQDTNLQIRDRLSEMLNNYIDYVQTIKQFQIEDIEIKISASQSFEEKEDLKKQKSILIADKYIERMQNIFDNSPISKKDDFYAAKIVYNSINYKLDTTYSKIMIFSLTAIFGTILGILFALISNAIQNRNRK